MFSHIFLPVLFLSQASFILFLSVSVKLLQLRIISSILPHIFSPLPSFHTSLNVSPTVFTSSTRLFHLSINDCTTLSPNPALSHAFLKAPAMSPIVLNAVSSKELMFSRNFLPVPLFHTFFHDVPIEDTTPLIFVSAVLKLSSVLLWVKLLVFLLTVEVTLPLFTVVEPLCVVSVAVVSAFVRIFSLSKPAILRLAFSALLATLSSAVELLLASSLKP